MPTDRRIPIWNTVTHGAEHTRLSAYALTGCLLAYLFGVVTLLLILADPIVPPAETPKWDDIPVQTDQVREL